MKILPLTRAHQFYPIVDFVTEVGVPIVPLLERFKLPPKMLETPDLFVDESRFWQVIDAVAEREGLFDLGFRVGRALRLSRLGDFGVTILRQPSLQRALEWLCSICRTESLVSIFSLERREAVTWFVRRNGPGVTRFSDAIEIYDLQLMAKLVASAARGVWIPSEVCLQARTLPPQIEPEQLGHRRVRLGSTFSGFPIPPELLARPMSWYEPSAREERPESNAQPPVEPDFPTSLRWLIRGYVDQGLTLGDLADLAGMSGRTLQRRLAASETCFSELLEQARFDLARDLLGARDDSVTEIGYDLGYSDTGNFSRAFKRWAGVSPREYRRQLGN